jgi:hypothetical protein
MGLSRAMKAATTWLRASCSKPAFRSSEAVDNSDATSLYNSSWRAAAWRDGASVKPLTVYTANHPAMSFGHDGCAGFGGFL